MADGGMYAEKDEVMGTQTDGTTIISIKYKGGILLGADSRSSNVSHRSHYSKDTIPKHLTKKVMLPMRKAN